MTGCQLHGEELVVLRSVCFRDLIVPYRTSQLLRVSPMRSSGRGYSDPALSTRLVAWPIDVRDYARAHY